jgi:hypothetical protein
VPDAVVARRVDALWATLTRSERFD